MTITDLTETEITEVTAAAYAHVTDDDVAAILAGEMLATTHQLAHVQWHSGLPWCTPIVSGHSRHWVVGEGLSHPELGDGVTVMGDVLACDGADMALREADYPDGWWPLTWAGIHEPCQTGLPVGDLVCLADALGEATVWAIVPVSLLPWDEDDVPQVIGWCVVMRDLSAQDLVVLGESMCPGSMLACPACSAAVAGLGETPDGWGAWRPSGGLWVPRLTGADPAGPEVLCPSCEGCYTRCLTWWEMMG